MHQQLLLFCIIASVYASVHRQLLTLPLCGYRGDNAMLCRNVPGDGSCLFNALAACLIHRETGLHVSFSNTTFIALSKELRRQAVEVLTSGNQTLHIEGDYCQPAQELLRLAAAHNNITADLYCSQMLQESTWGGGPEIVALANLLHTCVNVYDLCSRGFWKKEFAIRLVSCFGSAEFDRTNDRIHILFTDGRFPNIAPGQQKELGDHFLALFPRDGHQIDKRQRRYLYTLPFFVRQKLKLLRDFFPF